jgi:hypothetical protein
MIRLQRRESGPYFTDFSLHIPDMRVKIAKICARSPTFSLSNIQVRQAAKPVNAVYDIRCTGTDKYDSGGQL